MISLANEAKVANDLRSLRLSAHRTWRNEVHSDVPGRIFPACNLVHIKICYQKDLPKQAKAHYFSEVTTRQSILSGHGSQYPSPS
jgi:hypothetical protein